MINSEPSSTNPAIPPHWLRALRRLRSKIRKARLSPDDFLTFAFTDSEGRPLKQATIHLELQSFLSLNPKALVELPRDHGKTLQMCGRVVWELGHNPALRVKVVCANDRLAGERSRFLRHAIERNPGVRFVFPHLIPSQPWKAGGFTVARPADAVGPSVAAFGIGSGSTGTRADLLICDDVCDVRSLDSPANRQKVRDYFQNNLMNLLEPQGRFWGFCTPWHADDLNAHLKRSGAYAHFRRAVEADLKSIWPEKWSRESLEKRRMEIGEAEFGRGFRLLTLNEAEARIRKEWIQFWDSDLPRGAYDRVIVSVDPAVSTKARADATGIAVLGKIGNEIRVISAFARRLKAPDLVECLEQLDREWQPDVIVFENNGSFVGIQDMMVRHACFGPRIRGHAQVTSKELRVQIFSLPVQNGTVKLRGEAGFVSPGQRELWDEMIGFPHAAHDDLLDAVATGTAFLVGRPEPRVLG